MKDGDVLLGIHRLVVPHPEWMEDLSQRFHVTVKTKWGRELSIGESHVGVAKGLVFHPH